MEQEQNNELHAAEAHDEPALEPALAQKVERLVKELLDEHLADTRLEAYRKGVNERIDTLLHDLPALNDADTDADVSEDSSPLPHFTRRSIWNTD